MWKALLIAGLPVAGFAQGYGDTPLTQTYSTVTFDGSFMNEPALSTVFVEPLADGGYLEFVCAEMQTDECWTIQYTDFGNASGWGSADPTTPVDEVLATLSPVETRDRAGGDVFPLRDGADITWVEIWRSEDFDADYEMRLRVSCCDPSVESDLELSDDLWTLTFSYDNAGDVGVAHGGEIKFLYDATQNIIVERHTNNWWEDDAERFLSVAGLTGFTIR